MLGPWHEFPEGQSSFSPTRRTSIWISCATQKPPPSATYSALKLRHSREIDRFCSPRVTHHCTRMVQFARAQNRVRRAAIALPGQALPLLAVARFHHARGLHLETQLVTIPSARMMENQPARLARMISLALSLAQRQIVFFAWVSDPVTL